MQAVLQKDELNPQQVQFELDNMKRILHNDDRRLDYNKMDDQQVNNVVGRQFNFNFLDTQLEKDF